MYVLCTSLIEGGITPNIGLVKAVRAHVKIPIFAMLRPRAGDFLYSEYEIEVMKYDLKFFKENGVDGIVLGFLKSDGSIDEVLTKEFVDLAAPLPVTFHRAIDMCKLDCRTSHLCHLACLYSIWRTGVSYILTSGFSPSCDSKEARGWLERLVKETQKLNATGERENKLTIIAGGGITSTNLIDIVNTTGVTAIHGTCGRVTVQSKMKERRHDIFMGGEKQNMPTTEYETKQVVVGNVQFWVAQLAQL